jgi:hypothetical protein
MRRRKRIIIHDMYEDTGFPPYYGSYEAEYVENEAAQTQNISRLNRTSKEQPPDKEAPGISKVS